MLDQSRGILVPATPEEEVRQEVVEYLIEELQIPLSSIDTEYPLSRLNPSTKLRADIIVWHWDKESGEEKALVVLEVKAPNVALTDKTLDQVISYQQIVRSPYIGMANGFDFRLYKMMEGESFRLLADNLIDYDALIENQVEFVEEAKVNRLPLEDTHYDRYIEMLESKGYVGEGTDKSIHPFLSELQNFLLAEPISRTLPVTYHGLTLVQDLGWSIQSYENAAGGSFPGHYRGFLVRTLSGNEVIYRIGVFGTAKLTNDPVYGNRSGQTSLIVATEDVVGSHNSLQLNLDKSIQKKNGYYYFTHSGRLTNGKKGAMKIEKVKKYMKSRTPFLMKENKIELSFLPANKSISWEEGHEFVMKLLLYANVRDEIRQKYK